MTDEAPEGTRAAGGFEGASAVDSVGAGSVDSVDSVDSGDSVDSVDSGDSADSAEPSRPVSEPWEVFRREKDGDPMRHGGSVMAPDAELAIHYAREMYGRRQESTRLWVIRRADILDLDDPDLLQPPLDRSYKKPGGYVMRDKLAAARAVLGESKPKARSR